MTAPEVQDLLEREIGGQWSRTNLHHVNLKACLLPPKKIQAIEVHGETEQEVWLVLHEVPGGGHGFGVAFDEVSRGFGLVEFREGYEPCFLGVYGNFFTALEAM